MIDYENKEDCKKELKAEEFKITWIVSDIKLKFDGDRFKEISNEAK